MTWRVAVENDFIRSGIAVLVGEKIGDRMSVMEPIDFTMRQTDNAVVQAQPTLRLPDELGRALLDALSAYYGGTGDTRALRRDYDAERGRVDRLIDHLTRRYATGGVIKAGQPFIVGEGNPGSVL